MPGSPTSQSSWIFQAANTSFPGAVFSSRERAEKWISEHQLSGILTCYPVDIPVYDWAVAKGYFRPKNELQESGKFIGNFTCASLEHYHYEDGIYQ
jgi:hypothetical protein